MHGPYFFIEHFILDLPLVKAIICFIKQFGAVTRERACVKCPITTMMKSFNQGEEKGNQWKTVKFMVVTDLEFVTSLARIKYFFCTGEIFFGSRKIFFGSGKVVKN